MLSEAKMVALIATGIFVGILDGSDGELDGLAPPDLEEPDDAPTGAAVMDLSGNIINATNRVDSMPGGTAFPDPHPNDNLAETDDAPVAGDRTDKFKLYLVKEIAEGADGNPPAELITDVQNTGSENVNDKRQFHPEDNDRRTVGPALRPVKTLAQFEDEDEDHTMWW